MYNRNYKLYKEARDAAWKTLIRCNIMSLPIDLHKIINTLGYKVHMYSDSTLMQIIKDDVKNGDGFIIKIDETKHIYLNDKIKNYGRRRFTLGHEIGHGVLNHSLETIHFRNSEYDNPDVYHEYQANVFSRDILAPACVLKELKIHNAEDIMKICSISRVSAEIRASRLKELYERDAFCTSLLEKEVLENFKDFIDKYYFK